MQNVFCSLEGNGLQPKWSVIFSCLWCQRSCCLSQMWDETVGYRYIEGPSISRNILQSIEIQVVSVIRKSGVTTRLGSGLVSTEYLSNLLYNTQLNQERNWNWGIVCISRFVDMGMCLSAHMCTHLQPELAFFSFKKFKHELWIKHGNMGKQ